MSQSASLAKPCNRRACLGSLPDAWIQSSCFAAALACLDSVLMMCARYSMSVTRAASLDRASDVGRAAGRGSDFGEGAGHALGAPNPGKEGGAEGGARASGAGGEGEGRFEGRGWRSRQDDRQSAASSVIARDLVPDVRYVRFTFACCLSVAFPRDSTTAAILSHAHKHTFAHAHVRMRAHTHTHYASPHTNAMLPACLKQPRLSCFVAALAALPALLLDRWSHCWSCRAHSS